MRHARHDGQHKHHARGGIQRGRFRQQLRLHFLAHVSAVADARHDDRRRRRQQQRRDLRHQTVTDGQQHILFERLAGR